MGDGHLNKCIECTKKDVSDRESYLRQNFPEYIDKERERGREKYRRLGYRDRKPSRKVKQNSMNNYCNKFPEKIKAKNASSHIKSPDGKGKHHWSYNEEHYKDVIFLTPSEHYLIHRYMVYDQERMMYRTLEGVLLDTRASHLTYFNSVINTK